MKYFILAMLLATPALAANAPTDAQMKAAMQQMEAMKKQGMKVPNFDPKMVEAAQGMNSCMQEKLGDAGMKRMHEEGMKHGQELKALCEAGKKEEALALQMEHAKKMQDSEDFKAMKSCADKYKDALKGSSGYAEQLKRGEPMKEHEICAGISPKSQKN